MSGVLCFLVLVEPTFINTRVDIVNMEPDMNMVWKRGQSFRIFTGDSKNESELWPSIVVDHFVLTNLFRSLVTKKETRRLVSEISEMSLCHWAHLRQCFNRQGTGCLVAFDSKGCLLQIWNSCDCFKKPVSLQHLLHHSLHTRSFSNK